ncbi:MAG: ATP-binding protein [Pseudomonadota bacterium]
MRGHALLRVLSALTLLLVSVAGSAQEPQRFRLLVDPSSRFESPEAALAGLAALAPARSTERREPLYLNEGMFEAPVWIEVPLPPGTRRVVVPASWVERFEVYVTHSGAVVGGAVGGSRSAAAARRFKDPRLVLQADLHDGPRTLLLRHDSTMSPVLYPIQFFNIAEYGADAMRLHLRHGAFYGLMLLALAFVGIAALVMRRARQAYMTAYILGATATLSTLDGFLPTYLLPGQPELTTQLTPVFVGLTIASSLMFSVRFLAAQRHPGPLLLACRVVAVLALTTGLVLAVAPGRALQIAIIILSGLATALVVALTISAVQRRAPFGMLFALARLPGFAAFAVLAASTAGWKASPLAIDTLFALTAFEILILSIALALRYGRAQKASQQALARSAELNAQVQRLQAITTEAAALRQVQREIQDAQRLRTVNQMASGVAHDFNNIFTSVMGFSELLRLDAVADNPSQRRSFIEQINAAGHRGSDLVQQLLIYSRSTKPELKHRDLGEVVRTGVALAERTLAPDQYVSVALSSESLYALVDAHQIEQIIVNLLANASESMPGGGAIEVALARSDLPAEVCASCDQAFSGERLVLAIRDQGHGLAEPPRELFTPFHTSKDIGEGSGLGLSVVDGIVHEHGGHLLMRNRAEGGTEVLICLPLSGTSAPGQTPAAPLLHVPADAQPSEVLRKLQRYYPTVSSPATDALTLFLENPHAFALVVLEVAAANGPWIALASALREANPTLPILFAAGDATVAHALAVDGELQQVERTAVLDRSSELDALLSVIERLRTPQPDGERNIASLRDALRRVQHQAS